MKTKGSILIQRDANKWPGIIQFSPSFYGDKRPPLKQTIRLYSQPKDDDGRPRCCHIHKNKRKLFLTEPLTKMYETTITKYLSITIKQTCLHQYSNSNENE